MCEELGRFGNQFHYEYRNISKKISSFLVPPQSTHNTLNNIFVSNKHFEIIKRTKFSCMNALNNFNFQFSNPTFSNSNLQVNVSPIPRSISLLLCSSNIFFPFFNSQFEMWKINYWCKYWQPIFQSCGNWDLISLMAGIGEKFTQEIRFSNSSISPSKNHPNWALTQKFTREKK